MTGLVSSAGSTLVKRERLMRQSAKTLVTASVVIAIVSAVQLGAQHGYKASRTPWGDPDIQGNYTNLTEAGTPLEKPREFEGRNLKDISGNELRTIKRTAAERTINAFLGPTEAPDNWWQVAYKNIE